MKIMLTTGEEKELMIRDPKKGCEYTQDFIANMGALFSDFIWDSQKEVHVCDQEKYDWWNRVLQENQELENRIHALVQDHGAEAVYKVVDNVETELEYNASVVNAALDLAFGNDVRLCSACNGSGEGMAPDSYCPDCMGKGV